MSTNCCIYLGRDQHYYSVPYQHISKKAHVAYTRSLVKIYVDGELVATHPRDHAKGKYTIVEEHLASNSSEYRGLSAGKYIERARKAWGTRRGDDAHLLRLQHASGDTLPHMRRPAQPAEKQRAVVFRTACETALRHGRCNYRFIRSLVESKCAGVAQEGSLLSPPEHDNIRGREQFR